MLIGVSKEHFLSTQFRFFSKIERERKINGGKWFAPKEVIISMEWGGLTGQHRLGKAYGVEISVG